MVTLGQDHCAVLLYVYLFLASMPGTTFEVLGWIKQGLCFSGSHRKSDIKMKEIVIFAVQS